MHFNQLMGVCYVCSVPKNINAIELSIRNMNRHTDMILNKNKIKTSELRNINSRGFGVQIYANEHKYNFHLTCGCCSDSNYHSFKMNENKTLEKICSLLRYTLSVENNNINLSELKNSCRDYYTSLYHCIDRVQHIQKATDRVN